MFGLRMHVRFHSGRVRRAAHRGSVRSLGHAGARLRLIARRSIRRRQTASAPGEPPHTRKGRLRKAILYAVEGREERVVIGPSHGIVGPVGMAHVFGGEFRGDEYPPRTFMGPALDKVKPGLPKFWAGSVR